MLSYIKIISLGVAFMLPLVVQAETFMPELPKAKKKYSDETMCVEPIDDMRKNHMTYIMHQRDDTMRTGIRTSKHSLKECINCHNAPDAEGKVASAKSQEHFCTTCHTFAAVQIDCFTCHSDKPQNTEYRHSLMQNKMPHHADFAAQDIDLESLQLLSVARERQK